MWWILPLRTCVHFMYRKWGQWGENSGCSYSWFKDHICHFSYLGKAPSAVLFFLIIVFILKFNCYLEKTNKHSFCFHFYSSCGCYLFSYFLLHILKWTYVDQMFRLHNGLMFTSVNDQYSSETLSAAPQQASRSLLIIKQRTFKEGGLKETRAERSCLRRMMS